MSNAVHPSKRPFVIAAIMVATFMVAIEATIVATAMPGIVGQLGGLGHYSWVFSAFLLAQSTTTVIYGKLADIFGRKPTLIAGIVVFLIASLLCGYAWSMTALIGFRFLQGLGAGAIQPVTMTVIGDLYKIEERGRVQGVMSTVWATSGVLGPLAGGIIVDTVSWAWIFWINIPIGIAAIIGFAVFLAERVEHKQARIDYLGALLFSVATGSLLIILTEIEAGLSMLVPLGLLLLFTGGWFLLHEKQTPEPIVSIELWTRRLILTVNVATLLASMALLGLTTVIPLYVQGVLARSPIVAGFTITMLTVGWPLAVMLSSRLYRAFGIRRTLRTGSALFPIGATFLLFLSPESDPIMVGIGSFFMGFGMGIMSITTIAQVQESVEWSRRGSATASVIFARSLGSTLGATVLGALLNVGITHYGSGDLGIGVHELLSHPTGLAELAGNPAVRTLFDRSLHLSFWGVAISAALTLIATWLIPMHARRGPHASSDSRENGNPAPSAPGRHEARGD
ncbi:MAG: MFS transporter [Proteobacteria bacterium]|nr:MFS transporter [Pseudomonadota bacterium]